MHGEGAPLGGGGVEVPVLHMEVASADCLGAQPVEQRHLRPGRDAHWSGAATHLTSLRVLTVGVLDALFLLAGFGDDLNAAREEGAKIVAVRVEQLQRQTEVLPLIAVRYEQSFGRAVLLKKKLIVD